MKNLNERTNKYAQQEKDEKKKIKEKDNETGSPAGLIMQAVAKAVQNTPGKSGKKATKGPKSPSKPSSPKQKSDFSKSGKRPNPSKTGDLDAKDDKKGNHPEPDEDYD